MDLSEEINTLKAPSDLFGDVFLHGLVAPTALRTGEMHGDLRSAGHLANMRPESPACQRVGLPQSNGPLSCRAGQGRTGGFLALCTQGRPQVKSTLDGFAFSGL